MSGERFLVTGALGCVGAWTCRALVRDGVPVVAFDLGTDLRRLELVMTPEELAQVTVVRGDVTELGALERVLDEYELTHVVHLAALLIPLAKADPPRGALVNVVGTTNVFEVAKRRRTRIQGVAYASSIGAYDASDGPRVAERAIGRPTTHYGLHKQANEGTARAYWADDRFGSIGLRPWIVYGPGRDVGVTAAPTLAMEAAARGEPHHIPFGGRCQYHYAPEVAQAFVRAAREAGEGAEVRNLGGPALHMRDVVAAIEAAAPESQGRITYDDVPLPFPEEFEARVPLTTPIERGVRETIQHLRRQRSLAPA